MVKRITMIDLHLHLDGSLRPSTVRELLITKKMDNGRSIETIEHELKVPEGCRDLNEYLKRFDLPLLVLQEKDNITRAVYELGEDLHVQGITYAEIRFAPMLSTQEGLTVDEVVEAAIEGAAMAEKRFGIGLGLILCCMRGGDPDGNEATVQAASRYLGDYVCALDLAGAEALFETSLYKDIFTEASSLEIPFTIHAGEAAGPDSIWKALEYGASRIGHGVRCIEDAALVDYLVEHKIPLEVCITSNLQTNVFAPDRLYPIKELLDRGVIVTLNTDNMTVSGTNLKQEYALASEFGLTDKDIDRVMNNAPQAAFLQEKIRNV